MTYTPATDPVAAAFVDDVLRQIGCNRDTKIIRLALLMAYTAGYRDAVRAAVDDHAARPAA